MLKVRKTPDGKAYLHIWRTGSSYFKQKGDLLLKEWTNVMFSILPYPSTDEIIYYDIRKPMPFEDNSFDIVFALHIVEHLTPEVCHSFMKDIHRILKPRGIVRVSTPDFEDICREYLKQFEAARTNPTEENIIKYRWSVLELQDQLVRLRSGGLLKQTVKEGYFDADYAKERYGDVFDEFYKPPKSVQTKSFDESVKEKKTIKDRWYRLIRKFLMFVWRRDPRKTGEINKWMYDRISLQFLFEEAGFKGYSLKSYKTSDIPNWDRYQLDKSNHGDYAIEPSIYVEGRKS